MTYARSWTPPAWPARRCLPTRKAPLSPSCSRPRIRRHVDRLVLYSSYARLRSAPNYEAGFPPEAVDAFVERIRRDCGGRKDLARLCPGNPRHARGGTDAGTLGAQPVHAHDRSRHHPPERRHPTSGRCTAIEAPTLVLHSRGDPIAPPALGRYVAERIPGASYVEDDAGYHLSWDGGSAWFLEPIEEFVTGQPTSGRAGQRFLSPILCVQRLPATNVTHDGEVRRFGGEVVASTGEKLVAIIDSPSRAIACAASIQSAARRLGEQVRARNPHRRARAACTAGVAGAGLDIACAVAAHAHPGEILVSRTVQRPDNGIGTPLHRARPPRAPGSAGRVGALRLRPLRLRAVLARLLRSRCGDVTPT